MNNETTDATGSRVEGMWVRREFPVPELGGLKGEVTLYDELPESGLQAEIEWLKNRVNQLESEISNLNARMSWLETDV